VATHEQYRHRSQDERVKVMFLKMRGLTAAGIALRSDRDESTISSELRRNVLHYDCCCTDESATPSRTAARGQPALPTDRVGRSPWTMVSSIPAMNGQPGQSESAATSAIRIRPGRAGPKRIVDVVSVDDLNTCAIRTAGCSGARTPMPGRVLACAVRRKRATPAPQPARRPPSVAQSVRGP